MLPGSGAGGCDGEGSSSGVRAAVAHTELVRSGHSGGRAAGEAKANEEEAAARAGMLRRGPR